MTESKGAITIRNRHPRKGPAPVPLESGDLVTSFMRPDIRYTVVKRSGHMVLVKSVEDGGEGWVARTVLKRVEPET